jgi:UDP-N-acetylglucosamine--N-acetylmuramyl-(pentapeptide) pyrophosphoryl-undecaprenol N-acetylglucosamine transferase
VEKNAAMMIKDSEVKEKLLQTIIYLANNDASTNEMRSNIAKLAITDADIRVADEVLKVLS